MNTTYKWSDEYVEWIEENRHKGCFIYDDTTGLYLVGYDPDVLLWNDKNSMDLPKWFVLPINKYLQ